MMADVNEIDLYADDLGEEFNQENEFNENDLYDDVIASSNKGQHDDDYGMNQDNGSIHHHPGQNESSLGGGDGQPSKKIQIYVGNLSWWTTDQDVIDAITELGVNDVMEVKFFENRANGQSKGFCVVTLGSDQSVRSVIEKLGKNEIHGQNPVVTPCNRQNLNHFEMQSRKTNPGLAGGNQHVGGNQQGNFTNRNNFNMQNAGGGPGGPMRQPLIQRPQRPNGPLLGQPRMPMPHQGMGFGQPQGPWNSGGMPPGGVPPRPPAPIHPGAPPMAPMPMMRMPPQGQRGPAPQQPLLRGPNAQGDPRAQMTGGPMQEWGNEHVPPHGPAPQTMGMPQPGPVPGMPVPGGPAPHVNPAFFQPQHHQGPPNSQGDLYGNRLPPGAVNPYTHGDGYGRGPTGMDSGIPQITEQEFEEIMNKNRTVSSTAINRAVADASSGDYSSAIETLVTAISLIRQSKVANDERCKILISSLQDTLHGIEAKSYSSSRTPKDRPRSRERSRERSSRRDKRRDRSRSRERDYRDRSRDRDRYHDDRYHDDRYREKDRDRDHRSRH